MVVVAGAHVIQAYKNDYSSRVQRLYNRYYALTHPVQPWSRQRTNNFTALFNQYYALMEDLARLMQQFRLPASAFLYQSQINHLHRLRNFAAGWRHGYIR